MALPSVDFVGWHGEHYVVIRSGDHHDCWEAEPGLATSAPELKELPARRRLDCGNGVDLGSFDAEWLERKDVPMDYEEPGLA